MMDQKTNSVLADCYNQISEIWLSTAKIARGKIDNILRATYTQIDARFWEAFERRCCIRAGYYARLAEQHREPPSVTNILYTEPRMRSLDEIDELFRQTSVEPKGRAGGVARAKKLSKKRRSQIAKKAAKVRWEMTPAQIEKWKRANPVQLETRKKPHAS